MAAKVKEESETFRSYYFQIIDFGSVTACVIPKIYTPPPLLRYTFNVKQFTNSCENLLSLVRIAVLRRVFPLPVPVDGNSLFHSCAMYIQGSPDVCFYFRNALFLTLQKNASSESGFYQRWKRNHEKSFAQSQAVCTEEKLYREYENAVKSSETQTDDCGSFLVFVLSHVCRRPIILIGKENADEVKSSVFLPLLLSAGKCAKCPIYLTFCDGNFAPLVFEELSHSEESEISDFVIPLSVDRSQSFHVPYLYDNESRSIVLEEYLIVTKAPRVTAHGIEEITAVRYPGNVYAKSVGESFDPNIELTQCFSIGAGKERNIAFRFPSSLIAQSNLSTGEHASHSTKVSSVCLQEQNDDAFGEATFHSVDDQMTSACNISTLQSNGSLNASCTSDVDSVSLDHQPSEANAFCDVHQPSFTKSSAPKYSHRTGHDEDFPNRALGSYVGQVPVSYSTYESKAFSNQNSFPIRLRHSSFEGSTSRAAEAQRDLSGVSRGSHLRRCYSFGANKSTKSNDSNSAIEQTVSGKISKSFSSARILCRKSRKPNDDATFTKEADDDEEENIGNNFPQRSFQQNYFSAHTSNSAETDISQRRASRGIFLESPQLIFESPTTENNVSQAHEKTVSTLNAPEHAANGTAELRVEHQLSIPDCSAIVKSEYELHGFNAATSSSEEQEGEKVFIALYRERDTQVSVKNFTLKISARPSVSKRYDRTPGDALNFKLGKRYGGWVLDVKLPMYVAVKETNQPSWDYAVTSMLDVDEAEGLQVTHESNPTKCKTAGCMYLAHPDKLNFCQGCYDTYAQHAGPAAVENLRKVVATQAGAHCSDKHEAPNRGEPLCRMHCCNNLASPALCGLCENCFKEPYQ